MEKNYVHVPEPNMRENCKYSKFNEICTSSKIRHHDLVEVCTVIVEKDGEYFYLQDDIEKISQVIGMPDYIKGEWINYNKNQITIDILDELIQVFDYDKVIPKNYNGDLFIETISILKSLRRDLLIRKII